MDLGVGERNRGIAIEWRGRRREGVRARMTGRGEGGGGRGEELVLISRPTLNCKT